MKEVQDFIKNMALTQEVEFATNRMTAKKGQYWLSKMTALNPSNGKKVEITRIDYASKDNGIDSYKIFGI